MTFDPHEWARRWSPGSGPIKSGDVAVQYTRTAVRWDIAIDARSAGHAGITAFADAFLGACPDAVCTVEGIARDGDKVVVEWTWVGTHTGDTMEGWPARGEAVNLRGINVITLSGDLIADERSYWDAKTVFGG